MPSLEASLISPQIGILDIKVSDVDVVHHFTITNKGTDYEITNKSGELLARADASSEIEKGSNSSIFLMTKSHIFEIVQAENYSYNAYKKSKKM
jgi:hypothetical protein